MSNGIKAGDIAIAQYFETFHEYNGCECKVLNGLEYRGLISDDMTVRENVLRYRVEFPDGRVLGPLPHQLRKKPGPGRLIAVNDEKYLPDLLAA